MSSTSHEYESARFDQKVQECLEAAIGFAAFTGFSAAGSAHLALGLLSTSEELFDPLFRDLFSGLRSKTVFESLIDILKTEAEIATGGPPTSGPQMDEDAQAVIRRSEAVADEWNREQVTIEALGFALLEMPGQHVAEAFADAGVRSSALEALANRLADIGRETSAIAAVAPVFENGEVNLEAFGRVTRDALQMLARISASEPDRNLRDVDLIYCLAAQSESLMIESLYVLGAHVRSIRSQIEALAGNPSTAAP
ncbi:MAG TPA: hypothetical protein VNO14_12235, partial [Blastocatellia bacterium]|nr:hypothetical protein [Blastocatellia bacterium]